MATDANRPPSILLETNYLQSPSLISELDGIASGIGAEFQNPRYIVTRHPGLNRGVRGRSNDVVTVFAPRATQDVMPTQPISRGGNINATLTTLSPPSNSNTMVVDSGRSSSGGVAVTILCFFIVAPCCLAGIVQLIHMFHKRKRARMEQQLLAVSTNPTSRMLILSEILKDDCQPVTKDEAPSKKNRVLVKKYRRRTPSEKRLQGRSTDELETNLSNESGDGHDDDNKEGVVVEFESIMQAREGVKKGWDVENPSTEITRNERGKNTTGDSKPTIVFFSEDANNRLNGLPSSELDNVSTLEEEDTNDTATETSFCEREADEEVGGMGASASDYYTTQLFTSDRAVERQIITIGREIQEDITNVNTWDFPKKSEIDEMNSIAIAGREENDETFIAPNSVIRHSHNVPQSHETKDSPSIQTQGNGSLTPNSYAPTDSAQIQPPLEAIQNNASSMEESSGDVPRIPLLNIFVTTPTRYPARRAPTPESMLVESDATQRTSGVHNMPDLSDDEDSNGGGRVNSAPETRSIFGKGQCNDDGDKAPAVGGIFEIQACASSDTEVASNIEGLTEHLDSFAVESFRNAPSPFHQYLSERVNNNAGNSSEWDIPLQKVESYKSTTDYLLSSQVSYFSYEDVSIASDELESCAICLCSYEEGDVRIFSKRCPHAFHKECILEWLVKSQNCPCCRIDIVTKSEIDEVSASLIGTKRLAEAMTISEMQEAPPFSVRRSRLARQLMARARAAQRLRHSGSAAPGHNNIILPTPASTLPWIRPPTSPQTPRTNNVARGSDRFLRATSGFLSPPSPSFQAHAINPSRSSDAIMNPHESNQINQVSNSIGGRREGGVGDASIHTSNAGSLFTTSVNQSMFHDHWIRQRQASPPPMNISLSLSPWDPHPHWLSQTQHNPLDILRA